MVRLLVSIAALMIGSAASAETSPAIVGAVPVPPTLPQSGQTEDLKFRNEGFDRMTVPVRLSGMGPYRFLVDTGADRTAISRELAARLQLAGGDRASVHGIAGVSSVSTAQIPDLQLTRKAVRIVDAPVLESENMGADGILGTDSLKTQRVVFDFEAASMAIVPSAAPDHMDEAGAIVIEARRRNGRLIVTDAEANGRKVTVVVDTGSQISIGNEALRRQLLRGQLIDPAQQVELQSVTGQMLTGDYMFIRNIQLGAAGLRNLAVVFAKAHTFKQLGLENRPTLLLGMNALRAFKKVSIDFANRKFKVIVPEESANHVRLAELRRTPS